MGWLQEGDVRVDLCRRIECGDAFGCIFVQCWVRSREDY
jgi:hypothetical protein